MSVVRGLLVWTVLLTFCLLVWVGAVLIVYRFGWVGAVAIIAGLVALYEVVFVGPVDDVVEGEAQTR